MGIYYIIYKLMVASEIDIPQDVLDARARLAAKFGNSQIGGEGTMRRKKKVQHKTNVVDDKKLNAVMRRMNMQQIPGVEEINIIKDDNTVIHFTKPQLKGSIKDNSFVVSGNCENKEIKHLLPGILTQLGPKSMNLLKEYYDKIKSKDVKEEKDDDDIPDLPDLEENFEE